MSRIEVLYGGQTFTLGAESADEVMRVIGEAITSGGHQWLTVNRGEGRAQTARLLIGPGVPIAVVPLHDDEEGSLSGPFSTEAVMPPELG
jgi:hypothetical protein